MGRDGRTANNDIPIRSGIHLQPRIGASKAVPCPRDVRLRTCASTFRKLPGSMRLHWRSSFSTSIARRGLVNPCKAHLPPETASPEMSALLADAATPISVRRATSALVRKRGSSVALSPHDGLPRPPPTQRDDSAGGSAAWTGHAGLTFPDGPRRWVRSPRGCAQLEQRAESPSTSQGGACYGAGSGRLVPGGG